MESVRRKDKNGFIKIISICEKRERKSLCVTNRKKKKSLREINEYWFKERERERERERELRG